MACCNSCARAAKISGMARKTKKTTVKVSPEFLIGMAAGGATGGVVGSTLNKINFIQQNPQMAGPIIGGVKAGLGYYLLTTMDSDVVQGLGAGWIADGASDVLGGLLGGGVSGFRSRTLGTGYVATHNRKHRILGPGEPAGEYAEMRPQVPLKARVA